MVVVALMAAKLDGVEIATYFVFMPYWIVDGFVFCVGTMLCCTGARREYVAQQATWERSVGPFCATYTIACCLLAPLVVFCVLLSVNEYDSIGPTTLFAPLLFWFALTFLIGCCFARGVSQNNWLQTRREVEFTSQPRLVV